MAHESLAVRVYVRWWLRYYLYAVVVACWLTGMEPNMDRVGRWIDRGITFQIIRVRALLAA